MLEIIFIIGILSSIFLFVRSSKSSEYIIKKEIDTWVLNKIISEKQKTEILAIYQKEETIKDKKDRYIKIMLTIGGILIGVGSILFVASNWDYYSPFGRTALVIGANLLLYTVGGFLYFSKNEKYQNWGKSLILAGSICFGAAIYLIAQIYNLSSHYPNGVLFWFIGTLPFIFIFKDKLFLSLSLILFTIWIGLEIDFYVSMYQNPYKFVITSIFLSTFLMHLSLRLGQKYLSFLPLQRLQKMFLFFAILALIFSRFIYLDSGFSTSSYPLFIILIGTLGVIVSAFIQWQDGLKNSNLETGINIFTIACYMSLITVPQVWNAWIYIFIFESLILFYLFLKKDPLNQSSLKISPALLLSYLMSFLIFEIFENDIGSLLSVGLCFFALIIFLVHFICEEKNKKFFLTLSLLSFLSSSFILTFSDILKSLPGNLSTTNLLQSLLHLVIPLIFILYILSKQKILEKIDHKIIYIWFFNILFISVNFFLGLTQGLTPGVTSVMLFFWNILFLFFCFMSIYLGFEKEKTFVINLSLFYFCLWLIARYYDLFWELMDRSIFFIGGGIILMIVGLLFEKRKYFLKNNEENTK